MHNYIVDTHCHLDLIEEKGIMIEEILKNCEEKNGIDTETSCADKLQVIMPNMIILYMRIVQVLRLKNHLDKK